MRIMTNLRIKPAENYEAYMSNFILLFIIPKTFIRPYNTTGYETK